MSVDDLPDRLADLTSEAARTRVDFLRGILNRVSIIADIVGTEHQIGDVDAGSDAIAERL